MKITVIGTGNIGSKYNSASYMIDDDILIDMPNGMCKYLRKMNVDVEKVKHVLLTHFHGDHYFDVPFYLLLKVQADDKSANIYCDKIGSKKIKKLTELAFPFDIEEINDKVNPMYHSDKLFKIYDYIVHKYHVDHGPMKQSYGYVFEKEGKKVGFTGDTTICKEVEYMASICEYLICECTNIEGTNEHMGINYLTKLAAKYPGCKYLIAHMNDKTRETLMKQKINNVTRLKDGDIIEI